jgi:hypothetical protein
VKHRSLNVSLLASTALLVALLFGACAPGSALCQWLADHNTAVVATNAQGQSVDLCTKTTYNTQAIDDGGSAGGLCDPSAGDTTCSTCLKAACCAELTACGADTDCMCFLGCRASNGTGPGCSDAECAATPNDTYTTMAACLASDCAAADCPRLP